LLYSSRDRIPPEMMGFEQVKEMSSSLKLVFQQDFGNIPYVQAGLRSARDGMIHMAHYTEARIRHMHQMIDAFIETGKAGESPPGADF